MNCCTECFNSPYLKTRISYKGIKGDCNYCDSKDVNICDPNELILLFESIFDLYSVNEEGDRIEVQIDKDFECNIFSEKINSNTKALLKEITGREYESYQELFENNVRLSYLDNESLLERVKPLQITWEKFGDEIKNTNRFHLQNTMELELLGKLLERYKKPIFKGNKFFRSRISNQDGFIKDQMIQPPVEKARPGRANPHGISYLYIADSLETTLYETRASLYDYITVGTFRVTENINIINLRGNTYDPMLLIDNNDDIEDFLIHLPFISRLETELSKPIRRNDKELDYLPTQYLCEFIKSLGYDGVEYRSSLNDEGYNLAIFNPEKLECTGIEVHEVDGIKFKYNKV